MMTRSSNMFGVRRAFHDVRDSRITTDSLNARRITRGLRAAGGALAALCLLCADATPAAAAVVRLNNGDRLTGEVLSENDEQVILATDTVGTLILKKALIASIGTGDAAEPPEAPQTVRTVPAAAPAPAAEPATAPAPEPSPWTRKVTLGADRSQGNTEKSSLALSASADRKTDENELTLKGNVYVASSDKKQDAQQWSALGRYAYPLLDLPKWSHFYKVEGSHDKFANIHVRLTPSTGLAYTFYEHDQGKALAEIGLGWEHTDYRDATETTDDFVMPLRGYIEQKIFEKATISEDLTIYPNLTETGEFRLRSETKLSNPLSDQLALEFAAIDDYDSDPAAGKKKNDLKLISSISYAF